jgi:hypothetical protein
MQSVSITTNVVSSNPAQTRYTQDKDKKTELTKPAPPTEATVSPDVETSRSEKKKSDSDTSISTIVPSLPKAQSLPSHPHNNKNKMLLWIYLSLHV